MNRLLGVVVIIALLATPAVLAELTPLEQLGELLFEDLNLSTPPGQSCAVCHHPDAGFTADESEINAAFGVYHGAVEQRFGNRKPPSSAYAGDSPVLHFDQAEGVWIGGMFWDGRATGWTLDDPLAEQAMGPFLNPVEQNTPHAKQVIRKVQQSDYAELFRQVWGPGSLDPVQDIAGTYERIARSIAAYERSGEVNAFSSKYDAFLRGDAELTPQESLGLQLFFGVAQCGACHNGPALTDFTYDNLGLPKNPANPFYTQPKKINPDGKNWIDPGLGGFLKSAGFAADVYESEWGKHKVPTLRNVDRRPAPDFVKAYGHNGVFKSLEEIVHFYNTRDVAGAGWAPPEVPDNVNDTELGNLGLTEEEEVAIVAFLKTLSDGYEP
jgi:cytochrome c peroxidase